MSCVSEFPGIFHHENEVNIAVNGGADATVVVDKFFFGNLSIKGKIILLENFNQNSGEYQTR